MARIIDLHPHAILSTLVAFHTAAVVIPARAYTRRSHRDHHLEWVMGWSTIEVAPKDTLRDGNRLLIREQKHKPRCSII